jgi:hypothetical protein
MEKTEKTSLAPAYSPLEDAHGQVEEVKTGTAFSRFINNFRRDPQATISPVDAESKPLDGAGGDTGAPLATKWWVHRSVQSTRDNGSNVVVLNANLKLQARDSSSVQDPPLVKLSLSPYP